MTKKELLEKMHASRQALLAVLESVPPERREEPGVSGDWSVKDILVHLNYWEGQLVTLLYQLRSGVAPSTLHFSGRNVDELNAVWFEQGRERPWELAWSDFTGLGKQLPRRVDAFTDAELANPNFHPKLKKTPLATWITNDSFDHEDEHCLAIENWLKKIIKV